MTSPQRIAGAVVLTVLSTAAAGAIEFGEPPTDFQLYMWAITIVVAPIAVLVAGTVGSGLPQKNSWFLTL